MTRKLFAAIVCLSLFLCVPAAAVSVEQVQPVMPGISVYLHDEGDDLAALDSSDIRASLDGRDLTVESLAPSEEGIYYIFLLDISRSISQAHLEAARQAVLDTYHQLRPQDRLGAISFGNEVSVLLSGGEAPQDVQDTLNALRCTDNSTRFYDAMDVLVQTATACSDMRRIAVVVSDGIDDTQSGGMTQKDLEQVLRQSGVAVYALAVDSAPETALNSFRSFIQVSGGELFTFSPASAGEALHSLLSRIDAIWRLNLLADSNVADGGQHTLEIRLGSLGDIFTSIRPTEWVPDDTPPYILSLLTDPAAGTVTVTFSEALSNPDELRCYTLHAPGANAPALRIVSAAPACVTLAADGISDADGWELELSGLADASMEHNSMPSCTVPLSGRRDAASADPSAPAPSPAQTAGQELLRAVLPLIAGAAVLLTVLAAMLVLRRRRARSGNPETARRKRAGEKQSVQFFFHDENSDQSHVK